MCVVNFYSALKESKRAAELFIEQITRHLGLKSTVLHPICKRSTPHISSACACSPLSGSEEPSRAAAQVASVGVGAAVDAGVAACAAFIHVLAAAGALLEVEAGRTHALEAAQSVVAGGGAAHRSTLTLILICGSRVGGGLSKDEVQRDGAAAAVEKDSDRLRRPDSPTHWFHW